MARANRIRNSETTLQFMEGGEQIEGSLTCNTDWKIAPIGEITSEQFTGETEDSFDQDHRGWDFSGTFHELDAVIDAMYQRRIAAHKASVPFPELQIIVTKKYRDGVTPPNVQMLHGELMLKLDGTEGGGKDFVKNTISGKCQERKKL